MKKTIVTASIALGFIVVGRAAELSVQPSKDARIMGHSSEVNMNGGTSARLRATGIVKKDTEFIIMDFDRAELKKFVDNKTGITGKLLVTIRDFPAGEDGVELKMAAIDAASDWNEGSGNQVQAQKGESCATAAKFDEQKWSLPNGKEVDSFRDLVWDGSNVRTKRNNNSLKVNKDDVGKELEFSLDSEFIKHLATSEKCQGLFIYHEDSKAKVDIFSREQKNREPKLVLSTK